MSSSERNLTRRLRMGSMKLDLRYASDNFEQSVDKFFDTAFGPSAALYRRVTLCGWRPISNHAIVFSYGHRTNDIQPPSISGTKPEGIAVYETDEGMTIEVALTIIKEESLHLAILDKKLVIRGERIDTPPKHASFSLQSKQDSQFQHLIPLPESISSGSFRAQLKGDVVQIEFVKQ